MNTQKRERQVVSILTNANELAVDAQAVFYGIAGLDLPSYYNDYNEIS